MPVLSNDDIEKTEIMYGTENTTKVILEFLSRANKKLDIYADHVWPSVSMGIDAIKRPMQDIKKRGAKSRYIVEITKDNIPYCKELMKIDDLHHLNGIKGNFAINEIEYIASSTMQQSQLLQQVIYSNVKTVLEQHQYLFETLWRISIPAEQKIKEIEEGLIPDTIEIICEQSKVKSLYLDLVKNAQYEIMLILPTVNALIRHQNINAISYIDEAARERNVKVRILMPSLINLTKKNIFKDNLANILDRKEVEKINHMEKNIPDNINYDTISSSKFLDIRYIDPMSEARSTILLIDRKISLIMELKYDDDETFNEAIGLSIYSNSKPGAISYISIFENLWTQTELYQQIKIVNERLEMAMDKLEIHDKILNEFIHIASHELRNPIQPILGLSQALRSKITKGSGEQMEIDEATSILDIIIRNAKKMNKLTDNVLDIAKIESKTFYLKKETFDLKELIQDLVDDYISENNIESSWDDNNYRYIKFSSFPASICEKEEAEAAATRKEQKADLFLINADKYRITQVISNLLNNAIKFTNKGNTIIIDIKKDGFNDMEDVIVNIIDTGSGIDSEILPKLFTKFASKSARGGTGLGLYLSKCIIEAHNGKIWAENNDDGKRGATFSFRLQSGIPSRS
jgi:two-component system, OmpR family, sensor histidine kinase VicK